MRQGAIQMPDQKAHEDGTLGTDDRRTVRFGSDADVTCPTLGCPCSIVGRQREIQPAVAKDAEARSSKSRFDGKGPHHVVVLVLDDVAVVHIVVGCRHPRWQFELGRTVVK